MSYSRASGTNALISSYSPAGRERPISSSNAIPTPNDPSPPCTRESSRPAPSCTPATAALAAGRTRIIDTCSQGDAQALWTEREPRLPGPRGAFGGVANRFGECSVRCRRGSQPQDVYRVREHSLARFELSAVEHGPVRGASRRTLARFLYLQRIFRRVKMSSLMN